MQKEEWEKGFDKKFFIEKSSNTIGTGDTAEYIKLFISIQISLAKSQERQKLLQEKGEEMIQEINKAKRDKEAELDSEKEIIKRDNFFYNLGNSDAISIIKRIMQ